MLASSMREKGYALLAAYLFELLPDPPIVSDDHRAALTERLRKLADAPQLPEEVQHEARRLAGVAENLPSAIGRIGRVFIAWNDHSEGAVPGGYGLLWQPAATDDHDLYEVGPTTSAVGDALAWGLRRTDDVLIRPEWAPATYYWAGLGQAPPEFPQLQEGPG